MTISYILLDGGFFNGEFAVFAMSGVIVLGVGDSAAAVMGKLYGTTHWQETKYSRKTQEGSTYFVMATTVVYYLLILLVHRRLQEHFLFIVLATIPAAVFEGLTL